MPKTTKTAKKKTTKPAPAKIGKWIKAAAVRVRKEAGRLVLDVKR